MGSWGTHLSILVGLRKIFQRKVVENDVRKNAHVPVILAEMLVTQYVLSSSRHIVTPFDLHTFLRLTWALCRSLVVEGSVVRPWFLSNCSTRVPLALPGKTRSPSKRICPGTLSKKTRNWPIWQAAYRAMLPVRGPACARLCSGKLACTFSLRTKASSSVPSFHFLANISS